MDSGISLATWVVLIAPMGLVLVLALAGCRRWRKRGR